MLNSTVTIIKIYAFYNNKLINLDLNLCYKFLLIKSLSSRLPVKSRCFKQVLINIRQSPGEELVSLILITVSCEGLGSVTPAIKIYICEHCTR